MLMNRTTPFMVPVDEGNPAIIKDEALCSQCGHCFAICEEEIGVAAKYLLNPRETYQCIGCGQCSANCPEKAIIGKPHYKIVKELIKDLEEIDFTSKLTREQESEKCIQLTDRKQLTQTLI